MDGAMESWREGSSKGCREGCREGSREDGMQGCREGCSSDRRVMKTRSWWDRDGWSREQQEKSNDGGMEGRMEAEVAGRLYGVGGQGRSRRSGGGSGGARRYLH